MAVTTTQQLVIQLEAKTSPTATKNGDEMLVSSGRQTAGSYPSMALLVPYHYLSISGTRSSHLRYGSLLVCIVNGD